MLHGGRPRAAAMRRPFNPMIRFLSVLFVCSMLAIPSTAGEVRRSLLPSGHSMVVEIPFKSVGYKISGDAADAVFVSVEEGSSTAVVSAVGKAGRCQITFRDAEGEEWVVHLEVPDEIDELLPRLRKHLSGFDGLKVKREGARIAVSGTIGNSSDWGRFERILAMADFHKKVDDRVEFRIAQTELDALADRLREAGVSVAESTAQQDKGEVFLDYRSGYVLKVSGTVWSTNQVIVIRDILRKTRWSKIVEEIPDNARFSPFVPTVLDLAVADDLLRISVALVVVDAARFGDGKTVQAIRALLVGKSNRSGKDVLVLDGSIKNVIAELREQCIQPASFSSHLLSLIVHSSGGEQSVNVGWIRLDDCGTRLVDANSAEIDISMDVTRYSDERQNAAVAVPVSHLKWHLNPAAAVELGRTVVSSGGAGSEAIGITDGSFEDPVWLIIASVERIGE